MDSSDVVCSVSLHNSGQHNSDSIMLEEPQKTPNVSHNTNENVAKTPNLRPVAYPGLTSKGLMI